MLTLGTSALIDAKNEFFKDFIKEYVTVVAMNEKEAKALVGETVCLLALNKSLEYCDIAF